MTREQVMSVFNETMIWLLDTVRAGSRVRTGRLRDSFELVFYEDGFGVRTTLDYMQYTEMEWKYNRRWGKTLKNPNEQWFRNVALLFAEEMARRLGGVINVIS